MADFKFSPIASICSRTIPGWIGTLLCRIYKLRIPTPLDRIAKLYSSSNVTVILSIKSSANNTVSPRVLIALPVISMYKSIPADDALKSNSGIPWKEVGRVISNTVAGSVVRSISPGTSVKKIVAGHHSPADHCNC